MSAISDKKIGLEEFRKILLEDYRIINESRQASLMGRREVLTGKAKFGIFGDGKELAQIAMAKVFQKGDFRSGYYRDQTFMFAIGALTLEQWFAGLYAHTDLNYDPTSAGRQMGGHYATHFLDENGSFLELKNLKNSSSDISPTGSQMPRLLGLAQASYFFRNNPDLQAPPFDRLSNKGNEVAFGTIGDASTSEGLFWETLNAAGVLQVPMLVSVWDDGHGISVPKKYQTTKESISELLEGFRRTQNKKGFEIFYTKGWDYPHLCETYEKAAEICRKEHVPVLIHVDEVTQPQGHSTSGSHERYKSKERLEWEKEFDGIKKFREWMIANALAKEEELNQIEEQAKESVRLAKQNAWNAYLGEILEERREVLELVGHFSEGIKNLFRQEINELASLKEPIRKDIHQFVGTVLRKSLGSDDPAREALLNWKNHQLEIQKEKYSSWLYSDTPKSALKIPAAEIRYEDKLVDGREVLKANFDAILGKYPEVVIFGEDSGRLGDVNQGLEGLQAKYGEIRVFDTGIREATIMGQAIGLAMRGLRPIAEIQYLDYLLYALQIMSDDLATVAWRTKGRQKAPVIVRTRGHRLEGVWHSGSPMGMIVHACRGIHICVPRNMTVAAGFYNTLLESDDPALIVEPLNGYRLKERLPANPGEFKFPLGIPEVLKEGSDITLVSYGSTLRIVMEAAAELEFLGVSCEVVDVQTLLPFDLHHMISRSVQKTNKLAVIDEDVPGGASAFILQKILEEQKAFNYLDAAPVTITSKEHRPAYGSDGDYFSKPNKEEIIEKIYAVMHEYNPAKFPSFY
ncbi:MAG: thiamine pyrophosphate-dependent enzyme [Bacteroidia bacterium]|nr:thiamine pyrophosphate-dependent enzyme [Bacteroidia bacterium]